jgi:glycosyltransferase involved in cell wall biosynthesis
MTAVSVVMGVCNGERGLARTLDSVLAQEGCDFEFIVVDDGSTDGTAAMLQARSAHDSRLRVIRQANAGLTRALIAGCAAAQGRYIARIDAADVAMPGRLAKQAALLDANPGLAFVSCATRFVDADGDLLYEVQGRARAIAPTNIIDLTQPHGVIDGPTSHASVMFRRSACESAGGYRAEFYFGQDWDLWYRLAQAGMFQMLGEVLVTMYVAPGDISMKWRSVQEQYAQLSLECLRRRMRGEPETDLLARAAALGAQRRPAASSRNQAAAAAYFIGECLRRNGNAAKAAAHFRSALQSNPLHLKAWVRVAQMRLSGSP